MSLIDKADPSVVVLVIEEVVNEDKAECKQRRCCVSKISR